MMELKKLENTYYLFKSQYEALIKDIEEQYPPRVHDLKEYAREDGEDKGSRQEDVTDHDPFHHFVTNEFKSMGLIVKQKFENLLSRLESELITPLKKENEICTQPGAIDKKIKDLNESFQKRQKDFENEISSLKGDPLEYEAKSHMKKIEAEYNILLNSYQSGTSHNFIRNNLYSSPYLLFGLYLLEGMTIFMTFYSLGMENGILTAFLTLTVTAIIIFLSVPVGQNLKQRKFNKWNDNSKFTNLFILLLITIQLALGLLRFKFLTNVSSGGASYIEGDIINQTENINTESTYSSAMGILAFAINIALNLFAIYIYYDKTEENPRLANTKKKLEKAKLRLLKIQTQSNKLNDKLKEKINKQRSKEENNWNDMKVTIAEYPLKIEVFYNKTIELYKSIYDDYLKNIYLLQNDYKNTINVFRNNYSKVGKKTIIESWSKSNIPDIEFNMAKNKII